MKIHVSIIIAFFLPLSALVAQQGSRTIIEDLNAEKYGQGKVRVMQDEAIQHIVALYRPDSANPDDLSSKYVKVNGFKIQVFSDNKQDRSKREAETKRNQVREAFSDHEADVSYDPPVWRVRVGNFLTREEAEDVLVEMKKKFPAMGREMYIVPDVVKHPVGN